MAQTSVASHQAKQRSLQDSLTRFGALLMAGLLLAILATAVVSGLGGPASTASASPAGHFRSHQGVVSNNPTTGQGNGGGVVSNNPTTGQGNGGGVVSNNPTTGQGNGGGVVSNNPTTGQGNGGGVVSNNPTTGQS